jgi:hypothetical protein
VLCNFAVGFIPRFCPLDPFKSSDPLPLVLIFCTCRLLIKTNANRMAASSFHSSFDVFRARPFFRLSAIFFVFATSARLLTGGPEIPRILLILLVWWAVCAAATRVLAAFSRLSPRAANMLAGVEKNTKTAVKATEDKLLAGATALAARASSAAAALVIKQPPKQTGMAFACMHFKRCYFFSTPPDCFLRGL